uniref:Macrophage erythroblast attacher-like n=1 Tax=Tetraselmis sp. GSL018 TaxID=582737 RepID=A0A061RF38_9CHLO
MPGTGGNQSLDSPLLKVPLESLRRSTKDRRYIIDEVNNIFSSLQKNAADPFLPAEKRATDIDKLISKLKRVRKKAVDIGESEAKDAQRCCSRLSHLLEIGPSRPGCHVEWNRKRLDRILLDHLLRCGFERTADKLCSDSGLGDLVDTHIFKEAWRVVKALKERDCRVALAWCSANRSRLKRLKSNLEFKLRSQEFVELVRQGDRKGAIGYARQHLAPWAAAEMADLQRTVATLAFPADTACEPYRSIFDPVRWDDLAEAFLSELYRLHSLTPVSLLQIYMQAGLSALKTPVSLEKNFNKEDPLSLPEFRALAEGLPFAKHGQSKLVCSVTKRMMDENNPPWVMPNGYVYSEQAVDIICARNDGRMVCPITGESFERSELRRAYLA